MSNIRLDRPAYTDDVQHQSCRHILQQKHKFDPWLQSGNHFAEANCLLILCNRLVMMLGKQIENQRTTFKEEGGFTEALTAERLSAKAEKSSEEGAPKCPVCGKPMLHRMARKGINSGKEFWSCPAYPQLQRNKKHFVAP